MPTVKPDCRPPSAPENRPTVVGPAEQPRSPASAISAYIAVPAPGSAKAFAKKCRQSGVPFYFVTPKSSADYETSADISDMIIFNTTLENAFARFNIKA